MIRVLAIILVIAQCAFGAIRFEGNHHFRSEDLLQLTRATSGIESIAERLEQSYLDEGYFAARVEVSVSSDTVILIHEGRRITSQQLILNGIDTSIVDISNLLRSNSAVTSSYLEELVKSLVDLYAESGYPFCQVQILSIDVDGANASVDFDVRPGPAATFGLAQFVGLETTKPGRVMKLISAKPGERYRESELQRSERSLAQLEYAHLTQEPRVTHNLRTKAADLTFLMKDDAKVSVGGVFSLNSDNSIGGNASLEMANVFGTGEKVNIHWARFDPGSRDLGLMLRLPFIGGLPLDVDLNASQSDRDSSFLTARLGAGVTYHLNQRWSMGTAISWERITPEEGKLSPSARSIEAAFRSGYDGRDDLRNTRKGLKAVSEIGSIYRKSYTDGVASGYSSTLRGSLEVWQPLNGRLLIFQNVRPFQIRSDFDPIPAEQLQEIGGAGSMRGYRERSFLANVGVLASSELRYFIDTDFVASVFCDNAYIEANSSTKRLTGFGIGATIGTSLGNFGLDLSLGEEKQLGKMLVHFGFDTTL